MPRPNTPPVPPVNVRFVVREDTPDDSGAVIHDRIGDHNDKYFLDFVANTTWWALRNGKTVSIYPET